LREYQPCFTNRGRATKEIIDMANKNKYYKVPVLFREHTQWVEVEATSKEDAQDKAKRKAGSDAFPFRTKSWTHKLLGIDNTEPTYEVVSFTANNKGYNNEEVSFLAQV